LEALEKVEVDVLQSIATPCSEKVHKLPICKSMLLVQVQYVCITEQVVPPLRTEEGLTLPLRLGNREQLKEVELQDN
jgi:hypothetical protein